LPSSFTPDAFTENGKHKEKIEKESCAEPQADESLSVSPAAWQARMPISGRLRMRPLTLQSLLFQMFGLDPQFYL